MLVMEYVIYSMLFRTGGDLAHTRFNHNAVSGLYYDLIATAPMYGDHSFPLKYSMDNSSTYLTNLQPNLDSLRPQYNW